MRQPAASYLRSCPYPAAVCAPLGDWGMRVGSGTVNAAPIENDVTSLLYTDNPRPSTSADLLVDPGGPDDFSDT